MAQSFQSQTSEETWTEEVLSPSVTVDAPSGCTRHGHHLNEVMWEAKPVVCVLRAVLTE